jgi:hypothetical protein
MGFPGVRLTPGIAFTEGGAIKLGMGTEPDAEGIVGTAGTGVGVGVGVGVVPTVGFDSGANVTVEVIIVGPVGLETSHAVPKRAKRRKTQIRVISRPEATGIPGRVLVRMRRRPSAS